MQRVLLKPERGLQRQQGQRDDLTCNRCFHFSAFRFWNITGGEFSHACIFTLLIGKGRPQHFSLCLFLKHLMNCRMDFNKTLIRSPLNKHLHLNNMGANPFKDGYHNQLTLDATKISIVIVTDIVLELDVVRVIHNMYSKWHSLGQIFAPNFSFNC